MFLSSVSPENPCFNVPALPTHAYTTTIKLCTTSRYVFPPRPRLIGKGIVPVSVGLGGLIDFFFCRFNMDVVYFMIS